VWPRLWQTSEIWSSTSQARQHERRRRSQQSAAQRPCASWREVFSSRSGNANSIKKSRIIPGNCATDSFSNRLHELAGAKSFANFTSSSPNSMINRDKSRAHACATASTIVEANTTKIVGIILRELHEDRGTSSLPITIPRLTGNSHGARVDLYCHRSSKSTPALAIITSPSSTGRADQIPSARSQSEIERPRLRM
jgi:hypothetical protein